MQLGIPGTQRITQQGFLTPTGTPMRIYNVHFVSTDSITNLVLANRASGTSATGSFTDFLSVNSSPQGRGYWNSEVGMRFPLGVFVETSVNFTFATITFSTEF